MKEGCFEASFKTAAAYDILFVDYILQRFAGLKLRRLGCRNLDRLLGLKHQVGKSSKFLKNSSKFLDKWPLTVYK